MSNIQSKGDGHLVPVTDPSKLAIGTVLRMINSDGSVAPFSDAIVAEVEADCVKLFRPYAKILNDAPYKAVEEYSATMRQLVSHYRIVTLASGKPYVMAY